MLQEYFNHTIEQSFLKALLSATQLPKFKIIGDSDLIFEGYCYIYNFKIIRCTHTGFISPKLSYVDSISIGEPIISQEQAEYEVIDHYRPSSMDQNIETKEFIRASYYSTELHKKFGEYLRCLRDLKNIDLMGMYNCFSYEVFDDIHLTLQGNNQILEYGRDSSKKLLAVPVRFNQEYTVAIQSSQDICVFPILKMPNGKKPIELSNIGTTNAKIIHKSQFEQPFNIQVQIDNLDGEWYKYEKYLYLVFQVSSQNNSSFVVLEGKYDRNSATIVSAQSKREDPCVNLMYLPKLLQINTGISYAYSNTIIQYLLHNVVTNEDATEGNITYYKKLVKFNDTINYWDNNIKYSSYMKYLTSSGNSIRKNCEDVTGFLDKQIEEFLVYA